MDRKLLVSFAVLVAMTTAFAVGAILWFGLDAQLGTGKGRVWVLLVVPVSLAVLGTLAALTTRLLAWPKSSCLSEDAQRGLELYRSAGRVFFVGVGVLGASVQVLTILQAAGIAIPSEFVLRAFYFSFGVLLAYAGNFQPKMPALPDRWLGASGFAKSYRFAGWVFTLGGILMCFTALIVPIDHIQATTLKLICAIVGLPVLNGILLFFVYRKDKEPA
jgi:hypothetical protein